MSDLNFLNYEGTGHLVKKINSKIDEKIAVETERAIAAEQQLEEIKAPLASPALTGTPTAPTATSGTNTTQIATTAFVRNEISDLVNSAPETLDTIGELAEAIEEHQDVTDALNAAIGTKANVSDLTAHTGNTSIHTTDTERINWNDANSKKHTHSNKSVLDATTASFTTEEKSKLAGIASGANKFELPYRLQGYNGESGVITNPNSAIESGFYYVNPPSADVSVRPPFSQSTNLDYRLFVTAHSSAWLQQIATDFRCDDIFYRRRMGENTWTNWVKIYPNVSTKPSEQNKTMNDVAGFGNSMGMVSLIAPPNGTPAYVNPNAQTSWHHFINMSYTDTTGSNMWQTQIANKAGSTDLWVRSRSGGTITNADAWVAPWTRILTGSNWSNVITLSTLGAAASGHSHNYAGSSSAGGAATNALALSGYQASTTATANTVALRNNSGFLFASYFNQSSNAESATTSSYIMFANSDGYLRKGTLASIKTALGLGSAAYTASTAYATASHSHTAASLTPSAFSTPSYLVSMGSSGHNGGLGYTTIAQLKTTLGLGSAASYSVSSDTNTPSTTTLLDLTGANNLQKQITTISTNLGKIKLTVKTRTVVPSSSAYVEPYKYYTDEALTTDVGLYGIPITASASGVNGAPLPCRLYRTTAGVWRLSMAAMTDYTITYQVTYINGITCAIA